MTQEEAKEALRSYPIHDDIKRYGYLMMFDDNGKGR